jgi:hypothetical protein
MSVISLITDSYERKARLYPALVLTVPVAVTAIAMFSGSLTAARSLGAIFVALGGVFLLSQLARDAGKRGEKVLFARWNGMPSVAIFRHQDRRLDPITKLRYHKKLSTLVKAKAPTAEEEQLDPVAADAVYTAWSTYLRIHTHDTKKYYLLFQENVNYGYRRNVWGMRTIGIVSSVLCVAISAERFTMLYRATGHAQEDLALACILAFVFFVLWTIRFTPNWVRLPADAYAERLAETVDVIGNTSKAART